MASFTLTPSKSQKARAKHHYSPLQMKAIAEEWEEVKKEIIREDAEKKKKKDKEEAAKYSTFQVAVALTILGPPFFVAWTYVLQHLSQMLSHVL